MRHMADYSLQLGSPGGCQFRGWVGLEGPRLQIPAMSKIFN